MKKRKKEAQLWVAVKVQRGFVCEARLFESLGLAQQTERRWRSRLNPDYDEAAVVKARLSPCLQEKLLG
jgi:hypothetical protein